MTIKKVTNPTKDLIKKQKIIKKWKKPTINQRIVFIDKKEDAGRRLVKKIIIFAALFKKMNH